MDSQIVLKLKKEQKKLLAEKKRGKVKQNAMQADINKLKGELRDLKREYGDFRRAKKQEAEIASEKFCSWRLHFEDELMLSRRHTCDAVRTLLRTLHSRKEEGTRVFLVGSCSQFEQDELVGEGTCCPTSCN